LNTEKYLNEYFLILLETGIEGLAKKFIIYVLNDIKEEKTFLLQR